MNQDDAQALIDGIEATRYKPTKWETDFLASVDDKIENEESISDKQADVLQEIYRKAQQRE